MSKVYLLSESDVQNLKDKLDLSKFKASFPLHSITKSVHDPTQEQAQFVKQHWDVLVEQAHRHFVYYVHTWLSEISR